MKGKEKHFYTYIVECSDYTLYTGWTTDVDKRMRAHNGEIKGGAKYTKGRRPITLLWAQEYPTKEEAQAKEYAVKQLSRNEKIAIVKGRRIL